MRTGYSDYERGRYGRRYSRDDDGDSRSGAYGGYGRGNRDWWDRTRDEVSSWFGDDEAERRRRIDERHERESFRELRAGDVMTTDVICVQPEDSIQRAARAMRECDCGSLPVVDRFGRLIGVITDRDITVRLVARGVDTRQAVVEDAMTDDIVACNVNDSTESCLRMMARHQVRRLPVVDYRDRVVGIVSQGDLARHAGDHSGRGERRAVADALYKISEPARVS